MNFDSRIKNIDIVDDEGDTPFMTAIRTQHFGFALTLMNMDCDINKPNKNGVTPLMICVIDYENDIFDGEISDHSVKKSLIWEIIKRMMMSNVNLTTQENIEQKTVFHLTCNIKLLNLLLCPHKFLKIPMIYDRPDVDLKRVDKYGKTVLHYDIPTNVMLLFIKSGANVNAEIADTRNTVLHAQLGFNNFNNVHILLNYRVNINVANKGLLTPFMMVLKMDEPKLIKHMMTHGISNKDSLNILNECTYGCYSLPRDYIKLWDTLGNDFVKKYSNIATLLKKLKNSKISNVKKNLEFIQKKSDEFKDECPICYDSKKRKNCVIGKCHHMMCASCFTRSIMVNGYKEIKCPLCRGHFTRDDNGSIRDSRNRRHDTVYTQYTRALARHLPSGLPRATPSEVVESEGSISSDSDDE